MKTFDAETQIFEATGSDDQKSTGNSIGHLLASVIQSSLFFGIASEALGRNIRHEEFADTESNGSHLSMDVRIPFWYWRELKARWDELDDSLTTVDLMAKRVRLVCIIFDARMYVNYLDSMAKHINDDQLSGILLSVHLLLYLVAHVLDSSVFESTKTKTSLASMILLKRRMIKNGWCEKRLNFMDTSPVPYPAFYFLSSHKPPRVNAEDHSNCSNERCLITKDLSKPLHRTDDCLCEDVVAPVDRVNAIVASGGIPLVRITWPSRGKLELEVIPYAPSCKFIAISHVWADRQFGSAQNSIPKCQVNYLDEVISSLPPSMDLWGLGRWLTDWRSSRPGEIAPPSRAYKYFWLDSFCIPQAVEHTDLRSKAINSMNFIYAAASHTIVFDKGLQVLDAGRRLGSLTRNGNPTFHGPQDANLLDVIANIYASNWMGRAWTLQEGVLPGNIVFPLRGSLAYLKLLWPYHEESFSDIFDHLVLLISGDTERSARDAPLSRRRKAKTEISRHLQLKDELESLHQAVRHDLYTYMKKSLHVEEYRDYARTPVSDLFKSHKASY